MENKILMTSSYEGVSYGHPDKIADIIADSLVDEFISQDSNSRCGIEAMVKDSHVILGGEVKSTASIDYDSVVRKVFEEIVFPANHKLLPEDIIITNLIGQQSPEISRGVDKDDDDNTIGAGDQGIVFGFASNDTNEYMPFGNQFARDLWKEIIKHDGLGPDIKTQVTVDENKKLLSVVISTMHQNTLTDVRDICSKVIDELIATKYPSHKDDKFEKIINLNGEWRIGGPVSDCGVTGRKLAVDFYGASSPIGGGNLSGKDLSKVDRSGAYMARHIAKNIVAAGLADEAVVQLGYIISKPTPCSINVELKNGKVTEEEKVVEWIKSNFDLSVKGMIEKFCDVSFKALSMNGHFGNNELPWERIISCWSEE